MKIIIVDDDSTKFGRVSNVLVDGGVAQTEIIHATCVADALDFLRGHVFDLMLLDVNLPRRRGDAPLRGGGLEILREISRNDGYFRRHTFSLSKRILLFLGNMRNYIHAG